jgi:hypothetical protein
MRNSADSNSDDEIEAITNLNVTMGNSKSFFEIAAFTADNIRGNRVYKTKTKTLNMTSSEGIKILIIVDKIKIQFDSIVNFIMF